MAYSLTVDICEEDRRPIVRHVFFGKSRRRVSAVLRAHRRSDKFLRDCMDKGRYDGIACSVKVGKIRRKR